MKSFRIGNLPEELEHEILLRLPVKDLLECKCVCKVWYALIKSPSFVNRHFNHESNQDCLFFQVERLERIEDEISYAFVKYQDDERHSLVEETYHLRQIPADLNLMGLVNGIFCVMSMQNFLLGLMNPATRECKTLPPHPLHDPWSPRPPHIGFGLDPSSGDFKVVAFKSNKRGKFAFVYNLSSDTWKRIEAIDKFVYYQRMGIMALNGVQNYWFVKFVDHGVFSILAFDMRSEKFEVIAIPGAIDKTAVPFIGRTERGLKLTAYCDSLGLISYKFDEYFDLWVMGRDGLWSKSFSIGPFRESAWPSCVWKKNEVFFNSAFSHLIMCDISTKKVRKLIKPETDPKSCLGLPFSYKESLVSIKGDRDDCLQDLCVDYHLMSVLMCDIEIAN